MITTVGIGNAENSTKKNMIAYIGDVSGLVFVAYQTEISTVVF
jgi:hypothetical protein